MRTFTLIETFHGQTLTLKSVLFLLYISSDALAKYGRFETGIRNNGRHGGSLVMALIYNDTGSGPIERP